MAERINICRVFFPVTLSFRNDVAIENGPKVTKNTKKKTRGSIFGHFGDFAGKTVRLLTIRLFNILLINFRVVAFR